MPHPPAIRALSLAVLATSPAPAEVDFAAEIRPLFNAHCTACHGGVKDAGGVSFIRREQALGHGDSGKPVIVPGDPDASELIARITSSDPDEVMPKPEHGPPLAPEQVALLRQWIAEGAEWRDHWSFVAPQTHPLPAVSDPDWPRQPLDHFILARLDAEGLEPSPPAAPAAWLRRASLDLTGLPPTPAELDAFKAAAADDPDAAIDAATERLLASPRFGERWATMWLDLARYADSEGLGRDRPREIWPYRDWVIRAFNRDLPFDRFTIDQIAGDLVPDATLEQKIAASFHRLSQSNFEGGTDDEEFRVAAVLDRVNTTWDVWQGLTFGCVQCHSHPYDPIAHEEYYEFLAFFNQSADADLTEELPKLEIPRDPARYAKANRLHERVRDAERDLHRLRREIDRESDWLHPDSLDASADKARLEVVRHDDRLEFRADANAEGGSTYTLELPAPAELDALTALRVEFLPRDEETARHTPEWGARLRHLTVEVLSPDAEARRVELVAAIADEAHPLFDPRGSLDPDSEGWGTYSKAFHPRHAIFVPAQPVALPPGSRLRVLLVNGGSYLGSFPMIAKRGRLALADHPRWTAHLDSPRVRKLERQLESARSELEAIPHVRMPSMRERDPRFARETRHFERGNWLDKGALVTAADTPAVFPPLDGPAGSKPGRLELARWIASPENPLTARVAVNRFWLELFGTGIVPTPEDFGSAGQPPTHPELLDTLATRFAGEMNWSVKTLLRELVTSASYRQQATVEPALAERDPDNRLLARGPRQRLTGEMVRDHALHVAGLVHHQLGGVPARPPIAEGVWTPFDPQWDKWDTPPPGEPQRYRRSVYTYWKRSIPYPLFITFDAPTRELCSKRRIVSNTPLQALAVLNGPAFHEAALALGRRMGAADDLDAALARGFRLATSRQADPRRLAELRQLFHDTRDAYRDDPGPLAELADTPEDAAYTVVASVLLNLDQALTR